MNQVGRAQHGRPLFLLVFYFIKVDVAAQRSRTSASLLAASRATFSAFARSPTTANACTSCSTTVDIACSPRCRSASSREVLPIARIRVRFRNIKPFQVARKVVEDKEKKSCGNKERTVKGRGRRGARGGGAEAVKGSLTCMAVVV